MTLVDITNIDPATLKQEIDKAAASLDQRVLTIKAQYMQLLAAAGATDEETEAVMLRVEGDLASWRDQELERLRAWLLREGETVQ